MYLPYIWAPKYIKQILIVLERKKNSNTPVVGDFNIHPSEINTWSRQKMKKETE